MFNGVRHKKSLILSLSPTDPDKLKQSGFADNELSTINNYALQKLFGQKSIEEYVI